MGGTSFPIWSFRVASMRIRTGHRTDNDTQSHFLHLHGVKEYSTVEIVPYMTI